MKTCNWSVATVVLGALAASYTACSAQGIDNTIPGGTTPLAGSGSNATAGSNTGSGGSGPITGSGGSVAQPAGGSAPAAGGKFNTGVSGATSSGGHAPVGTGGSATGSGGSGTTPGGCPAAVGTVADLLIDDMEDGNHIIRPIGARVGYWFTYNDGTATQMPTGTMFTQTAGVGSSATSTKFAETSSTTGFTTWGGGIGFDFNNSASKSCTYDGSAYSGIKFWAKGNVAIRATVKIPGTTAKKANGSDAGTCVATATAMCDDHYGLTTATLTATWQQFTLDFAAATFAQEKWGTPVPFDSKSIIAMQFQVAKALPFDFSIDDVTFYK